MAKPRIFISYSHSEPDRILAGHIGDAFCADYDIFIDKDIPIGQTWGVRIGQELENADFLISLLSAKAVSSEMVIGEIAKAHRLAKERGTPRILPIRVAYHEDFPYPLCAWLDPIQRGFWQSDNDTSELIASLNERWVVTHYSLPSRSILGLPRGLPHRRSRRWRARYWHW